MIMKRMVGLLAEPARPARSTTRRKNRGAIDTTGDLFVSVRDSSRLCVAKSRQRLSGRAKHGRMRAMVETTRDRAGAARPERPHGSTALIVGGATIARLAAHLDSASATAAFAVERRGASGSSEALEALARADAGVAVVDMTLEGMRGAEGWRRARERWHRPIIVVCADGDDACARAALADGAEEAVSEGDPSASILIPRAIVRALARARHVRPEVELCNLLERWEALDGASHWYVMEIDHDDRITYLNRATPETPAATFHGKSVYAFTHPDAHAEVRARLEHVRRTGEAVTVEERGHGTLGDDSWFVARCLPIKHEGRVTAILVITEDVSERHRTERLLANSERRFRALIEKSSDAIVLLDARGHALYASPATSSVLGFAPEEIVGRDFTSLIHPEDLRAVLDARSTLHATPGTQVMRHVRLRHKDGTWRHVHGTGTNLLEDPAVRAVVGNYRDLTEQRALEEQVRRTQQWEAIGLLAGGIAHDFNNLLCIIMTAASSAARSAAPSTPAAAALDDITQASARAAELTRKLLSLGRTQPLTLAYVDAADVVTNFASLIRRSLGEDIEVVIACERPLPVRVDRLQIEQVLLNVCTNARQATQGRGRVRIEGRRRGASVEIAIHDDGPGIDEATLRQVFDPFFTTKREGSGLGLTVSYGIVERHGGSMRVDSAVGQGTMVTIQLPVAEGPRSERALPLRPSTAGAPVRVLVAEDEPALRRLVCAILRGEGYEVVEAADGEEAIAKCAADRGGIALAILDVRLPALSGPAAYARMVRDRARLPVLFVTGHAPDSEAIPKAAPLLMKPFTREELLRAVEDARREA
jgi:PAS domain S-box-containing protein